MKLTRYMLRCLLPIAMFCFAWGMFAELDSLLGAFILAGHWAVMMMVLPWEQRRRYARKDLEVKP